eukprot:scaffold679_cov374-Prasinococcus_capsulatus_cf.AAC.4
MPGGRAFVKNLCLQARLQRDTCEHSAALFVNKLDVRDDEPQVEEVLFIDQAVYTRNRAFRLVLSSKAKKSTVLLNTQRFGGQHLNDRQVFFATLVCNVPRDSKLLSVENAVPAHSGFSTTRSRKGYGSRTSDGQASPFPEVEAYITAFASSRASRMQQQHLLNFGWPRGLGANLELLRRLQGASAQHGGRPLLRQRGPAAQEQWSDPAACMPKLRLTSRLQGGFYQKCHDPDCRGYRSELWHLPSHILESLESHEPSIAAAEAGADDAQQQQSTACTSLNKNKKVSWVSEPQQVISQAWIDEVVAVTKELEAKHKHSGEMKAKEEEVQQQKTGTVMPNSLEPQ